MKKETMYEVVYGYQAPSVEIVEVAVETGFEASDADATVPDMEWDI